MSNPRRSLNDRVLWLQVLDALGLPVKSQALPTTTRCPFCKSGRLMILQDELAGGQWHSCLNCHSSGDMIELAAKVWRLGIPASVMKLASTGFSLPIKPDVIERYIEDQLKYRRHMAQLWKRAQEGKLHTSSNLPKLMQELHMKCTVSPEQWAAGPGHLLGGLGHREVGRYIVPSHGGDSRLFCGHYKMPWEDVLIFPFYDLPERICSFLFVGRRGREDQDYVFKQLRLSTMATRTPGISVIWESGVSMHPQIFESVADWNNTLVAIADPAVAVQLHARHCEYSERPLPIVSWYPSDKIRPQNCWKMFSGRKLIFWAPVLTRHIIQQAIETGGMISTIGPEVDSIARSPMQQYLWSSAPADLVAAICDSAIPWDEALAKHMRGLSNTDIEDLLLQLQLNGTNIELIKQKATGKLRTRLSTILAQESTGRSIELQNKIVIEREGGWYVEGRRPGAYDMIMDAQLRVDQIIHQPKLKNTYYQGRLIFRGEEVAFCIPANSFNRDPFKVLNQLLLDNEKGILCCNAYWNRFILAIAQRFHLPEFTSGLDAIGWNSDMPGFVLPHHHIELGGTIRESRHDIFPDHTPGKTLGEPELLSGFELAELFTDDTTTAVTWAAITAITANILAPAFNEDTSGILLAGSGAEEIAYTVAEALGCIELKLLRRQHAGEELLQREQLHNWPAIVVSMRDTTAAAEEWFDPPRSWSNKNNHNCITHTDWYRTMLRKLLPGWSVIEEMRPVQRLSEDALFLLKKFLPAYLLDLCQRRLQGPQEVRDSVWTFRVLEDIAAFVERHNGLGAEVFKAKAVLSPDCEEGYPEALVELVYGFMQDGKMVLIPEGFEDANSKQPTVVRHENGDIAIPKLDLASLLKSKKAKLTDFAQVSAILMRADVLVEDTDRHWIVSRSWWNARAKEIQNGDTALLKIYGT